MRKFLFILLFLNFVSSQGQGQIKDSIDIQKIVNEAKILQAEISDINNRMEDYANLNNVASVFTFVGIGVMILTAIDGDSNDDEVLFYSGAGFAATGSFMLYFNSNKLKNKGYRGQGDVPDYMRKRMKKQ